MLHHISVITLSSHNVSCMSYSFCSVINIMCDCHKSQLLTAPWLWRKLQFFQKSKSVQSHHVIRSRHWKNKWLHCQTTKQRNKEINKQQQNLTKSLCNGHFSPQTMRRHDYCLATLCSPFLSIRSSVSESSSIMSMLCKHWLCREDSMNMAVSSLAPSVTAWSQPVFDFFNYFFKGNIKRNKMLHLLIYCIRGINLAVQKQKWNKKHNLKQNEAQSARAESAHKGVN